MRVSSSHGFPVTMQWGIHSASVKLPPESHVASVQVWSTFSTEQDSPCPSVVWPLAHLSCPVTLQPPYSHSDSEKTPSWLHVASVHACPGLETAHDSPGARVVLPLEHGSPVTAHSSTSLEQVSQPSGLFWLSPQRIS